MMWSINRYFPAISRIGERIISDVSWLAETASAHGRPVGILAVAVGISAGFFADFMHSDASKVLPTVELKITPVVQSSDRFFAEPISIPDFPTGVDWINTSSRLQLSDLRGKLVLLDFWTYCCINCMHVLPVLDEAEKKYASQLVVVGVHSPKFDTERDTENVREAILRYEIKHPVINDPQQVLWRRLGIASWPTLVLINPDGKAIWANPGEITFEELDRVLESAVEKYGANGAIDARQVRFELAVEHEKATPLRFPGKIVADPSGTRLAISDSNHNRIVVTDLAGKLLATIGRGEPGKADGDFATAQFNHPQGITFHGETLFVADTENHLIRKIDLLSRKVSTVAGTGRQTRNPWQMEDANAPVNPRLLKRTPLETDLGSPWDLLVLDNSLYIAMAGTHQLWTMDLEGKSISIFAGNGREDIVDGPLLPKSPYALGAASFAQPSGLATDGKQLFVADSEGSSIRAVSLSSSGKVRTVVGTAILPRARLFTFGAKDGSFAEALMQHPLGVAYGAGKLYVADTYNDRIRVLDLTARKVDTLALKGASSQANASKLLDEPSGLCFVNNRLYIADTNNHAIQIVDLPTPRVSTMQIQGLLPPESRDANIQQTKSVPKLPNGLKRRTNQPLELAKDQRELTIDVEFSLPTGWKLNNLAPLGYVALWSDADEQTIAAQSLSGKFDKPATKVRTSLPLPMAKSATLQLALTYYFCREDGKGLCLADGVIVSVPVNRGNGTKPATLGIQQNVETKK